MNTDQHSAAEPQPKEITPSLPSPFGGCVAIKGKGVIPAKAGIQCSNLFDLFESWMPASADMTNYNTVSRGGELGWGGSFLLTKNFRVYNRVVQIFSANDLKTKNLMGRG